MLVIFLLKIFTIKTNKQLLIVYNSNFIEEKLYYG